MPFNSQGRVTAVLGPTNTGKTYLAIERMLGHRSGMIGFPLRLLARENYDRALKLKGPRQVALVTGEEKIVPPGARYFFCTVESMPVDRPVDFLAIDEVQLCADRERGHVFTDRVLHARGDEETMLLGAETIRPVLSKLVPEAETLARPRFSTLAYRGARNINRLPPRSAAIAFSASEVYVLAELLRRRRGGTAVVLGALSPRTRNAQVALFESGEVDFLVATDAIGMGLNLNLDHVAFSRLQKFDGRMLRSLSPAEIGQIAGRAGRHMNDGTFGVTGQAKAMAPELVEAVENHRFEPLHFVYWRNHRLDFGSLHRLLRSLERRPPTAELVRARETEDSLVLADLARDPEVERLAVHPDAVALLWEVCRIPDFTKILSEQHRGLLRRIYGHLMTGDGRLPEDWVARRIDRIDRPDGDIDALVARISHIRTWTYITHRGDWLDDVAHWQERTRAIEDRLSDALHERLTQRFVDRRTAILIRRLEGGEQLLAAVKRDGEVLVEGEHLGRLDGFRFTPDDGVEGEDARALMSAARRALAMEIPSRLRRLEEDSDRAFALDDRGRLTWKDAPVARLVAGDWLLGPQVVPLPSDLLEGPDRERLRRRLTVWLERHLRAKLGPLFALAEAELTGTARGLAFRLVEALGTLPRRAAADQIKVLTKAERKALTALGVRLGSASLFLPAQMKPRSARLRALLWSTGRGLPTPPLPAPETIAFRASGEGRVTQGESFHLALGYRRLARRGEVVAIRADGLERVAVEARKLAAQGPFLATPALKRLSGCDEAGLAVVLETLGYQVEQDTNGMSFQPRNGNRKPVAAKGRKRGTGGRTKSKTKPDSPFAKLSQLKIES
jgi:ATP-dependent RNA helicase SUPV3L1/SUV3